MRKIITMACVLALLWTTLGVPCIVPTVSAENDIDLLFCGSYGPNSEAYATVTKTANGLRADVTVGMDAHYNGYGLALEPNLNGINLSRDNGREYIHLVMESDVPFRITLLDRDPNGYKWISFGGEFFSIFVPQGFAFLDPLAPTIEEALEDGNEFMRAGKYDVYLPLGSVYEWKANHVSDDWDSSHANINAIYFETMLPGSFTVQEMMLTHSEDSCSHTGIHSFAPVYIPITMANGDTPMTTTVDYETYISTTSVGQSGTLYYTVSGGEATVTGYDGDDLQLTIPDTLDGKPVTDIGRGAFRDKVRLQNITLPSGLRYIDYGAFENCVSLESMDIPEGTLYIEGAAFDNCRSLYDVNLPSSLLTIGGGAFGGCPIGLVVIPDGVEVIPDYTFVGARTVVIPESVTVLGANAFGQNGYYLEHLLFTGTEAQFMEISSKLPLENVPYHYGVTADAVSKIAEHKHCVYGGYAEWYCSVCDSAYHDGFMWDDHVYGGFIPPVGHVIGADGLCEYCGTKDTLCLASPHPYDTDILHRYKVSYPDATSVAVTFSNDTSLEYKCDWLYFYDESGVLIEKYTGDELAGQTISVQGDTFEVILQADTANSKFGFEATSIMLSGFAELGNINGDNLIDMRDAFILYHCVSSGSSLALAQKKVADINGDGEMDMRDAFQIYRIAAGG